MQVKNILDLKQFQNLKHKYGNRHFWCKGYCVRRGNDEEIH